MPLSGYTSRTPTDVLLDTGILYINGSIFGPSDGGITFDPGTEQREVEYDGRKAPRELLDRKSFMRPTIAGTWIQAGPEDLRVFEPAGSGAGNTVTPKAAGVLFSAGEYLTNVAVTFNRGGGGTATLTFPKALCKEYSGSSTDNDEVSIAATFEARLGSASNDGDVPYTWTITDP